MFGGSLSEGLGSLFWRRFSVIFSDNRHNNSLGFSSVVFVGFVFV